MVYFGCSHNIFTSIEMPTARSLPSSKEKKKEENPPLQSIQKTDAGNAEEPCSYSKSLAAPSFAPYFDSPCPMLMLMRVRWSNV